MDKVSKGDYLQFNYINWEGKEGVRNIIVDELYLGSNKWHPENQFLLTGLDLDKKSMRCFAVKDMSNITIINNGWRK